MKKKIKKAFTLVELLVVIAILAILATVSIVGYNSFTKKAKVSNDTALVSQLNTLLKADEMVNGDAKTPTDALRVTSEAGYDVEKLTPTTNNYEIIWNQAKNEFALLDENKNVVYGEKNEGADEYKNWMFVSEYTENSTYSQYLKGTSVIGELSIKAGIDVGRNTGISSITYTNTTKPKDVRIVTNGNTSLEINGYVDSTKPNEGDVIEHYGSAANVNVVSCAMKSYHEFGQIDGNITLKSGHVSLENNSSVNSIVLDTTSIDTIAITQNDNATINGTIIALNENVKNNLANSSSINVKKDVIEAVKNVLLVNENTQPSDLIKANRQEGRYYCVFTSNVTFNSNFTLAYNKATNKYKEVSNIVMDLNGYTLTTNYGIGFDGTKGIIKNGKIMINASETDVDGAALSLNTQVLSGKINHKAELNLESVEFETTRKYGIFPNIGSEIVLKNTTLKAKTFGLHTNATKAQANSPIINIAAYDCKFVTESSDFDNSPICLNVPNNLYFENCILNGGRQAAVIRGGNATFKNCTLSVSGNFSSDKDYLKSEWGEGNNLPSAALVVGNRTSSAYDYSTTVTLLNTKLEVLNSNDNVYNLYAYGATNGSYTVSVSYDSSSVLGKHNLDSENGNVVPSEIK